MQVVLLKTFFTYRAKEMIWAWSWLLNRVLIFLFISLRLLQLFHFLEMLVIEEVKVLVSVAELLKQRE